ncbi:hypothetical protein TCAL_16075 [Tigriopus californicus]|uniref:CUB domain-containing protein n=1 Tax=Tigriopus californicus TaxID=6832 RepID=A0A553PQH6_TIGCA|nr:hypothetical protein TCAL_16075 [Tigriopus californicus]
MGAPYVIDYPGSGNYGDSVYCLWRFFSPMGTRIQVTIQKMDVEGTMPPCNEDKLTFYEGGSKYQTICGNELEPYTTMYNRLWVIFRSNAALAAEGFRITLTVM